ncbi:MAG: hypothetical protein UY63_C0013G0012 [Parcubacteria group bacterium GW2011_GWA2_51_10]|nr:MAG: hypothetical protein UY63_C0013G0012 [Parcubacteria group bacterium GW2011_GWA2_51_10]
MLFTHIVFCSASDCVSRESSPGSSFLNISFALLLGAAYIYLGATLEGLVNGAPPSWGIAFFAILLGAYRALYWIPYQLSGGRALGESSRTSLVYEVIIALMPAFAGLTLIAVPFAPLRLLFGAAVFAAISLIPLIAVKDSSENFSWSYGRSLSEFLADRHTALRIESILQGIQGAVLFLVWPLAIFLIVGSDYQLLGYILTATLVAVLFLRTFWRGFMRKTGLEHSTTAHVATSVSGWALRLFAWTPVVIFIADSYSHATAPRRTFTLDASVLEQAADSGSFVDEYTALKEIGLACGRIIIAAVFAVLLFATTLPVAFATVLIVAALASAASIILERRVAPSRY